MEKTSGKKWDLFKILTNVSLYLMIAIIVIFVLGVFKIFTLNSAIIKLLAFLIIVCASTWVVIPWARKLSKYPNDKKIKIVSYCVIGVATLCALLWIVAIFISEQFIKAVILEDSDVKGTIIGTARYFRFLFVFTIQYLIGNYVTSNIVKYGKEKIPYQVIIYACMLYFDYFLMKILFFVKIDANNNLNFSNLDFFSNTITWMLLVMSLLILIVASVFNKQYEKRMMQDKNDKEIRDDRLKQNNPPQESVETKLKNLKSLLESGSISQEEYDAKRAEILKDL